MDRFSTKDTYERESEEAERLVRDSPKVKPPRHDRRREEIQSEKDPDTDSDPDLKGDPDLSLNYKTIGGSMPHRVLNRWAKEESRKVKVRKKDTGWVGWVSQDTVKESPSDFEVVKEEEKGGEPSVEEKGEEAKGKEPKKEEVSDKGQSDLGAKEALKEIAKGNAALAQMFEKIADPNSDMAYLAKDNPNLPAKMLFKDVQAPKGIETIGDLSRILLLDDGGSKKKSPKGPRRTPETPEPEAEKLGKKTPEAEKKAPAKQKSEKPKPKGRPVSKEAIEASKRTLIDTFPPKVAADLLVKDLHPDEITSLVADYHAANAIKANVSKIKEAATKFYQTDPDKVAAPATVTTKEGTEVKFADLPPDEQEKELRKHQLKTVAMSLAARSAIARGLNDQGSPDALSDRLADFMLTSPKDEGEAAKAARASKLADDLFFTTLQLSPEKVATSTVEKVLKAIKDPATQKIAVGYFQARDYQEARDQYLDPESENHISEYQEPDVIARRLLQASDFLRRRDKLYPEGTTTQDTAMTFQNRVMKHLGALVPDKQPLIQGVLDVRDNEVYDDSVTTYKKAKERYEKKLKQAEADYSEDYKAWSKRTRKEGEEAAELPKGVKDRLAAKNIVEPTEPIKPPRYDLQRKDPEEREETASQMWEDFGKRFAGSNPLSVRVALKHLISPFSTYPESTAMGQQRQAVYWGVEPYSKGPESYAGWEQAQARDLTDQDYSRLLTAARKWLQTPVLSMAIDGIVKDTQLRAALDLAINTEGKGRYSSGLHPTVYNHLLAKLAGISESETLPTVRTAQETEKETMMPKFASTDADKILARLDRVASTIQEQHEKWGMPFAAAKELVNELDKTADEVEIAAFGQKSFEARQTEVVTASSGRKTAEVIQRDSDEKYMDGFKNPMQPIQTAADEPYMKAYGDDQSSAVHHGKTTTGRPLAP